VLLARLFARTANLIVLDEPTNDLDIESLELLEERLQDYTGTLLLVSHDRRFLDNVVTQTLVAEGNGLWREYAGGYSDYLRQRPKASTRAPQAAAETSNAQPSRTGSTAPTKPRTRMSHKDQRELAALPAEIEALELEQTELTGRMAGPEYHRVAPEQLRADRQRLEAIEALLLEKFSRWEALEA
jgi:ATP-binding cassette subfamily F protein uup